MQQIAAVETLVRRAVNKQTFVDKKTDISHYWAVIVRRKYSIMLLVLLAVLLAGIAVFTATPVYRAAATLLIEPEQPKLTSVEDLYGLVDNNQQYYLTQIELLKSRTLAEIVVDRLNLRSKPEFSEVPEDSIIPFSWLSQESSDDGKITDQKDHSLDLAVNIFEEHLHVSLTKNTQIIKVAFESASPSLAAEVANALADAYIEDQLVSRVKLTKQATGWLEERLKVLKLNLEVSEKNLQDYMESHSLVDVKGVSTLTANELQELMIKMVNAKTHYSELSKRYGYMHPRIVAARSELKAAEQDLARGKGRIQRISRKGVKLRELQRQVESNRQLYDTFLARLKEASQAVELHTVNARVSDPATEPLLPIKPKKSVILIVVLLGSLILGVLMVFVLEALDKTVRKGDHVEEKFGLRLLGGLPMVRSHAQGTALLDPGHKEFTEAISSIRTNLILRGKEQPNNVILVTSSADEEGKSTVASNLAVAFGKMQRVLLIDGDLRQSGQAHASGISGDQSGLSALLNGSAELDDCLHRLTDGVDVLPCGRGCSNPLELLSSEAMHALVEQLAARYDRIIIDSPAMQGVSDAVMLSRYSTAVIYVLATDTTHEGEIKQGIQLLRENHAPLVGLVLNKVS